MPADEASRAFSAPAFDDFGKQRRPARAAGVSRIKAPLFEGIIVLRLHAG
jgi:hypothetical protein